MICSNVACECDPLPWDISVRSLNQAFSSSLGILVFQYCLNLLLQITDLQDLSSYSKSLFPLQGFCTSISKLWVSIGNSWRSLSPQKPLPECRTGYHRSTFNPIRPRFIFIVDRILTNSDTSTSSSFHCQYLRY